MNPITSRLQRLSTAIKAFTEPKIIKVSKDDKKRISQYALRRHRSYMVNLGQQELKTAIAIAEDPDNPNRWELFNIYKEVYNDLHLQSQIRTAIYKVISEPAAVIHKKTREIDKEKTELLQKQWFEDLGCHKLEAEFWGPGLVEFQQMVLDEELKKLVFKAVKLFPREHVLPDRGEILINPTDTRGFSYREAPVNKWLVEIGDPADLGLLQYCARYSIYKKFGWADWAVSSEKWGDPILVVRSGSDDEKENDKKAEMAAGIGKNGWAVLDDDDEIDLLERKSTTGNSHLIWKDLIGEANAENSKGVNGQVGTADEKSFVGAAEVQERLLGDYTEARLRALFYFHLEVTFPYLTQVMGGNTAYADLKDYVWMPLRFMKELKTPEQQEEERRQLEQEQNPQPGKPSPGKPQPKGGGGSPAKKYFNRW